MKVFANYKRLLTAQRMDYEDIAWPARNLLELLVWMLYATKSPENAKRFYEDAIIDMQNLCKHAANVLKHDKAPETPEIMANRAFLTEERTKSGLKEEDKFLSAGRVALEVGMAESFVGFNGILSKLVHVTSMSLLTYNLSEETDRSLRAGFILTGLTAAKDSLDVFAAFCKRIGIDASAIEDGALEYPHKIRP